jgi:DNA-binding CsgD family transcriptional regulator/tetratricopeptide (TPR) repeat protein
VDHLKIVSLQSQHTNATKISMELLERAESLQLLSNGFRKVLDGEGHTIFICGEAGIGKSSVVRRFIGQVESDCEVLIALCDSLFTPRPLGVLYDLVMQSNRVLGGTLDISLPRTELFAQFPEAIAASHKPVVLVVEDIHWGDDASLDFIKFFARRILHLPCLFILTYRDNEITLQHPLRNVLGELPAGTFSRISLSPLSMNAVQALATIKGYKGEDVYTITGGNPFYVNEVLESYSPGIPENIKDAILTVYSRQKENTKNLWEILSIMPEGLEHGWLEKIDPKWEEAVENCFAAGVLLVRNNRTVFKHELYRRTIEASLSPFKRIELNKKLLELFLPAFESSGAIERIVHYAKNAADNTLVTRFAPIAARQAIDVGARREAAKLYRAAIDYAIDHDPHNLVQLFEAYAYECYITNQIREAIIYQTKALAIWQTLGNTERVGNSQRFLSRLWWYDGYRKEAEMFALESIATFQDLPSSKSKAMAYSNLSQLHMLADDRQGCVEWGRKAIDMAIEIGDEETRSHALNNVGAVELKAPALEKEGLRLLEESLQIALRNSFHEHAARAYTNLISGFLWRKNYDLAEYYLQEGLEYCRQHDLHSWQWYKLSCKARVMLEKGDWPAAAGMARSQLAGATQPGLVRIVALTIDATIQVRRGHAEAPTVLHEAKRLAFLLNEHLRVIPVVVACLEYEWITGSNLITEEELATAFSMMKNSENIWLNSEFDFWLKIARGAESGLPELFEPYSYLREGKATKAAIFWRQKGCPYEVALALISGVEDQKREALVILQQLGADAVYSRIKQEMRSAGIRNIPRGMRNSTLSNPAQLTSRELDVLKLLKTGASNKEIAATLFISAKTVDHHISSILFKLDASSRTKAVGEAEKLGILK